jgi:hypothetical protein
MQKIKSLFIREQVGSKYLATPEVEPECQWVIDGEGVPTEKIDGTCCAIIDGVFYARHRVKTGKVVPDGWLHWSGYTEQKTGHGWVPVGNGPEHKWHREAWDALNLSQCNPPDGTYEMVGPKVQRNPCGLESHALWKHGLHLFSGANTPPRNFDGLREWLESNHVEGIVWHHPDGRMCKLKRRDFGIPWSGKE